MTLPLFSRVSGFGALFDVLEAEAGAASVARALQSAGITDSVSMTAAQGLVPFAVINAVFNEAAHCLGDGALGARIGATIQLDSFAPFTDFALAGDTLGDVIRRAIAAQRLHSNELSMDLYCSGAQVHWRLRYHLRGAHVEHHAQRSLMMMLGAVRRYADHPERMTVNLVETSAADAAKLARRLGVTIATRQSDYELVLPKAWLGNWTPVPGWPVELPLSELPAYIDQPLPADMTSAVRAALRWHEDNLHANVDATATELGISRRQLQRQLDRESISYRDLLRYVRIENAKRLLTDTAQPIAEIALRVGYSDQANFHRAFVDVAGTTPGQFRKLPKPGQAHPTWPAS